MANYYIQGSGEWPFGLDTLSVSGQLLPSRTDENLLVGYFGFPVAPIEQRYLFRIWENLDTTLDKWYGKSDGTNNISILRSKYGFLNFEISPNIESTIKITFDKNTKAYSETNTPNTKFVNFISNNSSIIGTTPSLGNSGILNLYYNGWYWEKDFTFNITSTINYKIVLEGNELYGDNNQDGVATLGENFISLNVSGGNTYRFRAKIFTSDLTKPLPNFEYEVLCLTCPKQNQFISTPYVIYNKIYTDRPFSLNAQVNSNLPLYYSTEFSDLFKINSNGGITLLNATGSGIVSIFQPGNNQWNPISKQVIINIEDTGSCFGKCLDTGSLYFNNDTYLKLYNVTGLGLFLDRNFNKNETYLISSNESWQSYYTDFTGYGLSGFDNTSAGIILNIDDTTKNNNQNKFNINYGVNEPRNIVGNYHKQLIKIRPQKPKNVGYLGYFANDSAWATYDVSTGMITGSLTPNNVFSYGVDIVTSGVLSGRFYYTGDIDVTTETGKAYVLNLEKNPELYTKIFSTLSGLSFNNIANFCSKFPECEEPSSPESVTDFCYTGELTDTISFQIFLSGVNEVINTTVINRPDKVISLAIDSTGEIIKYADTQYTGYILYNNWQSGDYIKWDLYGFDYIDLYQTLHLGNYPPYPNTGFILYYPNDFDSLESLVNKLNENVDVLKTYPVWYPYDCLKDTESGIFITGELVKFYKNTDPTGSFPISHFNNRIDFISLRSFPQVEEIEDILSYGMSIFSPKKPKNQLYQGWSYLIPTVIQLEGLNRETQNWDILHTNRKEPGVNSLNFISSLNNTPLNFEDSLLSPYIIGEKDETTESMGSLPGLVEEEEEKEESPPESEEEELTFSLCKEVLFTDEQRNIDFNQNPLCPPNVYNKPVIVSVPKEECKEKTIDENGNIVQKRSNFELCQLKPPGGAGDDGAGGGSSGGEDDDIPVGDYYIINDGSNFGSFGGNTTINSLSLNNHEISVQNSYISDTIYDKYKISLSNFLSLPPSPDLIQKNSFFIRRVKLFNLDTTGFNIHKGPEICSIGSDYTIDVSGLIPIEVSGIWEYNILPEESGIYRFFNTPFARKIEENEKTVKFNKVSGQIISPSGTGFLSTSGYGVGTLYYENSDYYFYDPSTQSVYFTEILTGLATGFGILSGDKTIIKQSIINQELLLGGRLADSNSQYHEISSNGTFISNIDDVEYVQYDVLGFYPITGRITGNTENGRLDINDTITITGSKVGDIFAYYPVPTGFTFSQVEFNIDYNLLNNFNVLSLNDNTIIYHSDSSSYPPPTYFNSNESLISIINESSDIFLCTGEIDGSNIKIYSTLRGESGNIDITSNSTGIQIINFVSGLNIYPRLYKIKNVRSINCIDDDPIFADLPGNCTYVFNSVIRDPIVTGDFGDSIFATGFYYSNVGSGNITGNVSTFTGVRTFFDIWDIATGNFRKTYLSFLENNFISGNSFYKNTLFGTSARNVNLRAFYRNYLDTSPQEENDVADLIIKDLNNPGLSETGIVFRLNGLK